MDRFEDVFEQYAQPVYRFLRKLIQNESEAEELRHLQSQSASPLWFDIDCRSGGLCGYTYGMEVFGKDELEVLDADTNPNDLRDFLVSLVSYVLKNDMELPDGESIGFSKDDKHAITRSVGAALSGMTLKITF